MARKLRQTDLWSYLEGNLPSDPLLGVCAELVYGETDPLDFEQLDALPRVAPWRAAYRIESGEGGLIISEVRLEPTHVPVAPLPAQIARRLVKPGAAIAEFRRAVRERIESGPASGQAAREAMFTVLHGLDLGDLEGEQRGRRRPDYFYAAIAERYVAAHTAGSRRPVADVADDLPAAYKAPFVRDALVKARDLKLLEETGRRRAGGELTALGREVLAAGPPDDYVGPEPPTS
jgi:hypothetical protein